MLYYQEGLGSKVLIQNLCSREPRKTCANHRHHSKEQNLSFYPAKPGYSGYRAGYSGPCCPESPDVCSSEENVASPEFPGLYPESPGNPDPMASFQVERYKYPSIPFQPALLPSLLTEHTPKQKKALTPPPSSFLSDSFGDLSESEARARIHTSEPHSHRLSIWFWSSPRISSLLLLEPCAPRRLGVLVIALPRL